MLKMIDLWINDYQWTKTLVITTSWIKGTIRLGPVHTAPLSEDITYNEYLDVLRELDKASIASGPKNYKHDYSFEEYQILLKEVDRLRDFVDQDLESYPIQ